MVQSPSNESIAKPFVVRLHLQGFEPFCVVVLVAVIGLWFISLGPWWVDYLVRAAATCWLVIAVFIWRCIRVPLVVDQRGIWCGRVSLRGSVLIPWSHIESVGKVQWKNDGRDFEGILLGLRADVSPPGGDRYRSRIQSQLEEIIGGSDLANPVLLQTHNWDRSAAEVLSFLSDCHRDSQKRHEPDTRQTGV
jgi:hypothetical protein